MYSYVCKCGNIRRRQNKSETRLASLSRNSAAVRIDILHLYVRELGQRTGRPGVTIGALGEIDTGAEGAQRARAISASGFN